MSHIAFTKFRSTNTSPTSLNDSSQGYDLGSIWINESDDEYEEGDEWKAYGNQHVYDVWVETRSNSDGTYKL